MIKNQLIASNNQTTINNYTVTKTDVGVVVVPSPPPEIAEQISRIHLIKKEELHRNLFGWRGEHKVVSSHFLVKKVDIRETKVDEIYEKICKVLSNN